VGRALGSLVRVLVFAGGLFSLLLVWRFVVPGVPGLVASNGPGALILELSLSFAAILTPFALMAFALRPALWKFCALPLVWALVATIILRPGALEGWF